MRSLVLFSMFSLLAGCSMISSMSAPTAKAEVYSAASTNSTLAAEAAISQGQKVGAMLLPEYSQQLSNLVILKGVGRTGLKVINGADSFDAARIQRYKDQAGVGKFEIAPEDKGKFEGVRYIIIYSHFSAPRSDGPFIPGQASGYFDNKIEMKFWDVATGELVAICEASGTYGSPNKFDGMEGPIADALRQARLPGVQ